MVRVSVYMMRSNCHKRAVRSLPKDSSCLKWWSKLRLTILAWWPVSTWTISKERKSSTTRWLSLEKVVMMYFYLLSRQISVISFMNFLLNILLALSVSHMIKSFPLLLDTMVLRPGDNLPTVTSLSCPLNTTFCCPLSVHSLKVVSFEPVRIHSPS
jgi:hypothetical protein